MLSIVVGVAPYGAPPSSAAAAHALVTPRPADDLGGASQSPGGLLRGAPGATSMQAYWTLADADDPAAAAWIARPANGGARVTNGGRPHDLMLFAVHGNATRNHSSASTIRASKRVGRGQGALLASLMTFLSFLAFVSLGRRSLSEPSFRARSNVWSCVVAACLSGGGSKKRLEVPPPDEPEAPSPQFCTNALRLMGCGLGVFVTHLAWGFLQERIMTQPYPAPPYYFTSSNFLVLSNRFAAVVISAIARIILGPERCYRYLPPYKYSFCAYANVVSSMCQYEMLKYVSFPAQVLSKSCKMLPVMLMSFFVSGKRHGVFDWVTALLVVVGASAFQLGSPEPQGSMHDGQLTGILLIGGYIASDAFAAAWQAQLFKQSGIDIATMMLFCNLFSCIFTMVGFVATLEFIDVWRFVTANPHALADIAIISVASAFGQGFILLTIKYYGAAVFAAIATVRQLVSILVSIAVFSHRISSIQIVAIALVFAALGAQCIYRWRQSRRAARAAAAVEVRPQGALPELIKSGP